MVDKFTKWIEAKLVKTAKAGPMIDFISGVVHRYGVSHIIITDNGSNFTAGEVKTGVLTWALNSTMHPSTTLKQMVRLNEPMA